LVEPDQKRSTRYFFDGLAPTFLDMFWAIESVNKLSQSNMLFDQFFEAGTYLTTAAGLSQTNRTEIVGARTG